jgi:hypothetical protein
MEGLFEDFLQGWRAVVGTAWPEVIPNGIWDPGDPGRLPYDEAAGALTVPFAALDVAALTPSDNWGADNRVWEPVVDVYYVMETTVANGGPLRAKLEHLADYVETNGLPVGQVILPEPELSTADMLGPNALLLMLNATQRVGRARFTTVLGVLRESG